MIIKEIGIRNFKSYGNATQKLKLSENGQLILLVGENGSGKSTLLSAVDIALYGKVKGTKRKWATLSSLPNRINGGNMVVDIDFISNSAEVKVIRGVSPNTLELWENGILNEKAGKASIDKIIEDYVGLDIEAFKAFISMSVDSFKDFISLSNEEKKLLLDKLFNLEIINTLNDILKGLVRENKEKLLSIDAEIKTLDESINSIRNSINKSIEREKSNIQLEIDDINQIINSKKEEYRNLKEKVDKIKEKEQILSTELDSEKKQFMNSQNDLRNIDKEISLYNLGKCPTCATNFNSEHFIALKELLIEKRIKSEGIVKEIENNIKKIKEKQKKLSDISTKTNEMFNNLNYLLRSNKAKLDELNKKRDNDLGNSVNIEEFKKTIEELDGKKDQNNDYKSLNIEKQLYYKELNRIFSEDGVKKSIIANIIKPINHFIAHNIKVMGLPFEVYLDETFSAEIKNMNSVVDNNTLSTGETKLINISILVAYLKLIRTKKHINILFLDEVFSSIDLNNIGKILNLLRSFSNEYNINIFVVHHAILNQEMFDRVIQLKKDIFSTINEVDYEQTNNEQE